MINHLEKENISTSELMTDEAILRYRLKAAIEKCVSRFPHLFDGRLQKGLELIAVNSSHDFLRTRSFCHLQKLLLCQFFLQKKMEKVFETEVSVQKPLFLKLFKSTSRISVSLIFHDSYHFDRDRILNAFHLHLPGYMEMPRSFYLWHHPELPYLFCYLEVHKLRGEEISKRELKSFENALTEQLIAIPPLTPALFWPFNEEESYRHVQLLQKEVHSEKDLPHVLVQFREQTPISLEFLIHLARPQVNDSLEKCLDRLPDSLHFFCHFTHLRKTPFPLELAAFSLKVPALAFDVQESINLLYARRYILKYLEAIIGPFRDYNGGLFEAQQQHFESIRVHLGGKIRHFELFAEKVFYALHPVEQRLSLSLEEAEDLFTAFSEVMQVKSSFAISSRLENVIVVKTAKSSDLYLLSRSEPETKKKVTRAQLIIGGFNYLCFFSHRGMSIKSLLKKSNLSREKTKMLRLIFQEGAPASLNPCHSFVDMRCRLLSKLLFEGLTRLNQFGNPELSGATNVQQSPDGYSYTFKLRPSHWSNGEKVTAVDYVMSLQCALSDHVSHPELLFILKNAQLFKEKKVASKELGIRAIDAETLHLELERPDSNFLHKLAKPFFFPLFGSMREPKWFNGPYLVRKQDKEGILLEKNPYFWDAKRSFFEQIEIHWQNDVETIYTLFHERKIDWIGDPLSILSSSLIKRLEETGKLHKHKASRRFIICFNTKHPILCSPLIRRALSLSIDRAFICKKIFPHSTPVPSLYPVAEEAVFFFEKGLKELNLSRENFPILTLSFSHQTRREMLAEFLQKSWQKILGISIRREKFEWNLFRNKLEKGRFEISGIIQETLSEDSLEFYERSEGKSSWNFSGWTHGSYREIIESARKETNARKKNAMLAKAEKILLEEVPFTPLFNYTHLYAHHAELENYFFDPEGCIDFCQARFKDDTEKPIYLQLNEGEEQCGKK
jgi:oligopeptide transport system substrate-binding protein